MKPTLQLKIAPQLTLTPQLQQTIRLLQLSTQELQAEIEAILANNPLLERNDSLGESEEGLSALPVDTTLATSWGHSSSDTQDEQDMFNRFPHPVSLREHLLAQLGELTLPEKEAGLVAYLIEELNDQGYLERSLEAILADLPSDLDIDLSDLTIALRHLQHFDPAGIGARSLGESLCIQLTYQCANEPNYQLAYQIADKHLSILANKDYTRLRGIYNAASDMALREAVMLITRMNPRPAAGFAQEQPVYVVPDILVKRHKTRWVAVLNPQAVPNIRIQTLYARVLFEEKSNYALLERLQEAKWLVKSIHQRAETILRVAQAIVERQQSFFTEGDVGLRPLVQREIAEVLGLHESTVSRVTSQKYLVCSQGMFELKYFFGSGVQTASGEDFSAMAVKTHIRDLIREEKGQKPLSDNAIAIALKKQGICVARRTVAKYREAMKIPAASLRKTF